jgi:hypothetical protein
MVQRLSADSISKVTGRLNEKSKSDPVMRVKLASDFPVYNVQNSQDGHFSFQIHGVPTQFFVLQTSTNLITWENVSTNQCVDSVFNFEEPIALDARVKFYRVVPWP